MTENPEFLQNQLITYIGNKRSLLPFIGQAVKIVQDSLQKQKLSCLDLFSGSGVVARYLKQFAGSITVNDLEIYSACINRCYLSNQTEPLLNNLRNLHSSLTQKTQIRLEAFFSSGLTKSTGFSHSEQEEKAGFISELYAPSNIDDIKITDRCFYTPRNAAYIDICRKLIQTDVPKEYQDFFIAPLLSEASIHANTAGVFKGFYKNSSTKTGQFGGNGKNALSRIMGNISLPFPVFSEFNCPFKVFNENANDLATSEKLYELPQTEFDLAYFDPPYNQHPYGSNYFMLNLITTYIRPSPETISRVSGIPKGWNHSQYNKKKEAAQQFLKLVQSVRAKYLLVSFNSEGFIPKDDMIALLSTVGSVQVLESQYNTFRGSRNLNGRNIHVKEYLFLVKKQCL